MLRLVLLAPHTILRNQHHALLRPERVDNITAGLGAINIQILRGPVPSCILIQLNIATNLLFLSDHAPTTCTVASSWGKNAAVASKTTTILGIPHQLNHLSRLVFEVCGEFIAALCPKRARARAFTPTHTDS
jgi:hypothetical protein